VLFWHVINLECLFETTNKEQPSRKRKFQHCVSTLVFYIQREFSCYHRSRKKCTHIKELSRMYNNKRTHNTQLLEFRSNALETRVYMCMRIFSHRALDAICMYILGNALRVQLHIIYQSFYTCRERGGSISHV